MGHQPDDEQSATQEDSPTPTTKPVKVKMSRKKKAGIWVWSLIGVLVVLVLTIGAVGSGVRAQVMTWVAPMYDQQTAEQRVLLAQCAGTGMSVFWAPIDATSSTGAIVFDGTYFDVLTDTSTSPATTVLSPRTGGDICPDFSAQAAVIKQALADADQAALVARSAASAAAAQAAADAAAAAANDGGGGCLDGGDCSGDGGGNSGSNVAYVDMPNLIGYTENEAKRLLRDNGYRFTLWAFYGYNPRVSCSSSGNGYIYDQDTRPGAAVTNGGQQHVSIDCET